MIESAPDSFCQEVTSIPNRHGRSRQLWLLIPLVLVLIFCSGCVYYNTFYHARSWYKQAEKTRQKENRDKAGGSELKLYQDVIKKCSKVISEHPNSSYMDDALFMIGKSFYYLTDYPKAERKFRELLSSFPKSKYADESKFFLGKTRFRMENYVLASEVFEEYAAKDRGNQFRPEALYLSGETSLLENDSAAAVEHYQKFVSEYKDDPKAREVQYRIGEIQFERAQYTEAGVSFALAEKLAKTDKDKFQARYQQGRVFYQIDSVSAGLRVFEKLAEENKDSVFQADILLRIADGKYLSGEQREAILLYDLIATTFPRQSQATEANYTIGKIVQNDWGDLDLAKSMYDQAAKTITTGKWGALALARSADITKVGQYRTELSDSAKDIADNNRFLLAELYRTALNLPDSALSEYKSLVDSFPNSKLAPRSLLAVGYLYENHYHDTASAREYYQKVVDQYPSSDEYPQAVQMLGMSGTPSDSLTPGELYSMAETQLFDANNADSARALFQRLLEQYPDSKLAPRADFALARIELTNFDPKTDSDDSTYVDSTMILRFLQIAEKYPHTQVGNEAKKLAEGTVTPKVVLPPTDQTTPKIDSMATRDTVVVAKADSLGEAQLEEERLRKEIEVTPLITVEEPVTKGEFVYPVNALGTRIEGKLMLKIKIEFDGKVSDISFLKGSGNNDIDREVRKALLETYFNPIQFDPGKFPGWFIYYYEVKLPEIYK
jgi:TonB family protein